MRGKFAKDRTGQVFGELKVVNRAENHLYTDPKGKEHTRSMWVCQCSCGKTTTVRTDHLLSGKILSCGCVGKKHSAEAKVKHGQTDSRLYRVWHNMKARCYNRNVRSFKNYGANGVKICSEWLTDFGAFSRWAFANGYDPEAEYGKCTIDRIDPYGDYCPENCRWVDLKEQAANKRKEKHGEVYHAG